MAHEFTFCLGSHVPGWLSRPDLFEPATRLFYSFNTLSKVRGLKPSAYELDCDSGGFTRLSMDGNWDRWSDAAFVAEVRRICSGLGRVVSFAIKDWMCEPQILAKTGLSVDEHQRRTVESFLRLRDMAPEIPWLPVLQGWEHDDYLRCWERYEAAGVALRTQNVVGLGSTCRRHKTDMVEGLVAELHGQGLHNLHALGMKTDGLRRCVHFLKRSDSLAWSVAARNQHIITPGCQHGALVHRIRLGRPAYGNCANCPRGARVWYDRQQAIIRRALSQPVQQPLFRGAA